MIGAGIERVRRRLLVAVSVATGIALTGTPARADEAARKLKEANQTRAFAAKYATCLIKQSPTKARRYVIEGGNPPTDGGCLNFVTGYDGVKMTFPGENYRYALADALLTRDYPAGLPDGIGAARPLVFPEPKLDEARLPKNAKQAAAARAAFDRRRAVWMIGLIGDCVVRADPAGSYMLTRSELATPAERAAFNALKPAIAGCLPAESTIRFPPAMLRGTIAARLYQLAYSLKAPSNA